MPLPSKPNQALLIPQSFASQPINRRQFTQMRRMLPERERKALAHQASLHLYKIRNLLPKKANVGIYLDAFGELPTQPIVDWCQRNGHRVFLPVVGSLGSKDKRLRFVPMRHQKLINLPTVPHALGMNQLKQRKLRWATELDVILCPLVAVDTQGNRMGMGGGYYDTTLANIHRNALPKPLIIGWCYDFQVVETLPRQPWDVPMDMVMTPTRFIRLN